MGAEPTRRPRLRAFAAATALVLAGIVAPGAPAQAAPNATEQQVADAILAAINALRTGREGLAEELKPAQLIAKKSFAHSKKMAKRKRMNHAGFKKRARQIQRKLGGAQVCENVAYAKGYGPDQVVDVFVDGWDRSAGHHKCMFDKNFTATDAGVGIKKRGKRFYGTFIAVRIPT